MRRILLLSVFILSVVFPFASTASQLDPVILKNAVDASSKAEGAKLDDYALVDQDGQRFMLSDYFKAKKPLVLSYIYTSCPQVCPTITAEFKKSVETARERFGDKFNVLTIGFDTDHDTTKALHEYGRRFTGDFHKFRFASADKDTVEKLLSQTGFFHVRQDDGSFDHIDMVTTVKPDGTIYKQVYSLRTQPQNLSLRLEELVTGKAGGENQLSFVDQIKFFCYKYDPYTGRYVPDYPVFASIILQALVIGAIIYAVWGKRIKGRLAGKGKA